MITQHGRMTCVSYRRCVRVPPDIPRRGRQSGVGKRWSSRGYQARKAQGFFQIVNGASPIPALRDCSDSSEARDFPSARHPIASPLCSEDGSTHLQASQFPSWCLRLASTPTPSWHSRLNLSGARLTRYAVDRGTIRVSAPKCYWKKPFRGRRVLCGGPNAQLIINPGPQQ